MITFRVEPDPVPVFKELIGMLKEHKAESNQFGESIPLEPDWRMYQVLHDMKTLHVVTARKDDDEVVGYCIDILSRHLHYPVILASNDIIFMTHKYRGHALRLIKFVEEKLKEKKVGIWSVSVKPHVDFSPVLKKMGFDPLESLYFRRL